MILNQLHPIFAHLPVENMVFQNQQRYYDAIGESTAASDSQVFIEFMLNEILDTLKNRQGAELSKNDTANDTANDIVNLIKINQKITIDEIAVALNKSKSTINRKIKQLQDDEVIARVGSDKSGHWAVT